MLEQQYQKQRAVFEKVARQLEQKLRSCFGDVALSYIHVRVKEQSSFLAKVKQKKYQQPFVQCTDIVGARIVCLFGDDIERIRKKIEQEFAIDHQLEHTSGSFNYTAHHCIVHFCDMKVEIQIRTALHDAWANMEHHVNYKKIGVDEKTQKKMQALNAMLDLIEEEFIEIKRLYVQKQGSEQELTPGRMSLFLQKKFAWYSFEQKTEELEQASRLCILAKQKHIQTISQLQAYLEKHLPVVYQYESHHIQAIKNNPTQWPDKFERIKKTGHFFTPHGLVTQCLNLKQLQ
ncbi:MAG: GTP pyrophosphokinase [Candidatus Woesearchaeota archaeon]